MNRPPKVRPKIKRLGGRFLVAKYSYEFKKKVVQAYLSGEGGYTHLAEKYGVKNKRQVLNWVRAFLQSASV